MVRMSLKRRIDWFEICLGPSYRTHPCDTCMDYVRMYVPFTFMLSRNFAYNRALIWAIEVYLFVVQCYIDIAYLIRLICSFFWFSLRLFLCMLFYCLELCAFLQFCIFPLIVFAVLELKVNSIMRSFICVQSILFCLKLHLDIPLELLKRQSRLCCSIDKRLSHLLRLHSNRNRDLSWLSDLELVRREENPTWTSTWLPLATI